MRHPRTTSTLAISTLLLTAAAGPQESPFELPIELTADGAIIDVGKDIGHAGPLLRDHDGDGKTDLLVSSFRGTIQFFRNVGTSAKPAYESQGKLLTAGGTELKFHNW